MKTNTRVIAAILFMVAIMLTVPAIAATDHEICDSIGSTASVIMEQRQNGASFQGMYGVAVQGDAASGGSLQQLLVRRAYTYPQLLDYSARDQLIASFGKEWYNRCMELRSK